MNKTAPTRTYRSPSVPTSSGPPQQPVPSTSSRNASETTIACCRKCHGCTGEGHSYPDDLSGASLDKILRHEDDIRWDEQLRERSRLLREERIRQEERFEQRQRMQDQERLLREERQFQADLERRREADNALLRELERENEAEARATDAVLQILASTQPREIARSSAGADQGNQPQNKRLRRARIMLRSGRSHRRSASLEIKQAASDAARALVLRKSIR
ncbi:hypothetical protein MTO96_018139 [Rhipicephalus appendiculatus]